MFDIAIGFLIDIIHRACICIIIGQQLPEHSTAKRAQLDQVNQRHGQVGHEVIATACIATLYSEQGVKVPDCITKKTGRSYDDVRSKEF